LLTTWQDVVVTVIAAVAAVVVLRPLVPAGWFGRRRPDTPCANCAAGAACAAAPPVTASATPVIQVQRRSS
jgi:hypothetical protein